MSLSITRTGNGKGALVIYKVVLAEVALILSSVVFLALAPSMSVSMAFVTLDDGNHSTTCRIAFK